MATKKVRYAVVGVGNIAQMAVLPAFEHAKENSELVALISSDPHKLEELGEHYRIEHRGSYEEFESVLRRARADAVYIALPNTMHCEFTERAAKAGVHVLCEKPMAMSVSECETMIRACQAANVKLMIAYRLHFEEANLRAMEIARSGKLGKLRSFDSVFGHDVRPGDIRTRPDLGGGALFDMGIYCINAARHLFGEEPIDVVAFQTDHQEPELGGVDATTSALLRFPADKFATFTASQSSADVDSYRIVGSEGVLRVEPAYTYRGDLKHYLTIGDRTTETLFTERDQFAPELVTFSKCVLDDTEPEASGQEGLADVRILKAIAKSARRGEVVQLRPFQRDVQPDLDQEIRKPPVENPKVVHAPPPHK
ncbi:Gfo/Idh/MocA family protein [Pendulispora albinea]|uniref:Gfo/Idh/MocA family oxidoreductase n=1 Tax=Pendulispora albinea TaxID=2741071 RepID=A0ABZ2LNV2_9BACT